MQQDGGQKQNHFTLANQHRLNGGLFFDFAQPLLLYLVWRGEHQTNGREFLNAILWGGS